MSKSKPAPLLPGLLHDRLIPWASDNARQRIIVARPVMKAAELPDDVQLSPRKIRGKRLVAKGRRLYGNTRILSAEWAEEGLIELEIPKLVCVVNGLADYQVGKYLLSCNAGHFIFVPPQTPHPDGMHPHLEGSRKKEGFCELLQIVSYRRGIQCMICQSRGPHHAHVDGENYLVRDEQANDLFHLMMEEAISCKDSYELVCENLLATFLTMLHRAISAGRYLLPGPRVTHETPTASSNDFASELDHYVLAHLGEQLTLEGAARQMHLSRSQFARRIREQTGQTFIAYLTDRRLQEAKILLCESEWTTVAISEFIGFKSSTYFHRLFRSKMGMTPGAFRLRSRQDTESQKDTNGVSVIR